MRRGAGGGPAVAADLEAGGADLLEQHLRLVTTNVTARVVERRPHGRVHRGREDQHAAGTADPGHLVEKAGVILDMLDDLEGEHGVEGPVREGERASRGTVRPPRAASRFSAWAEASMKVDVATGAVGRSPGPISRTEPPPTRGASQFHTWGRTCTTRRDPLQWSACSCPPEAVRSLLGCLDLSHRPSVVVEAGSIPGGHVRARHGPNAVGRRRRSRSAEADGNRTRQRARRPLVGFEDRGAHQEPRRLHARG